MFACESSVESNESGTGGGTGGTQPMGCDGPPSVCVDSCEDLSSEFYGYCDGSVWTCPSDSVRKNECEPCPGDGLDCEACNNDSWVCSLTPSCVGSCPGTVCRSCDALPELPQAVGPCMCACGDKDAVSCDLIPGCCQSDSDCTDGSATLCVGDVCKAPVDDACWLDDDCQPGETCVGVFVCGCTLECGYPDVPGTCTT